MSVGCRLRSAGLAFLATDDLLRVLDALALVGLRLAERADLRGGQAEEVLVDPLDREPGLLRVHLGGDALGELEDDRVGEAEGEVDLLALDLRLEADAADLEHLLVALAHAVDGVADEGAGEAVEAARLAALVGAEDLHLARADLDLHHGVDGEGHLPLRTLDLDRVPGDGDLHLLRDLDWKLADSRHDGSVT